MYVRAKLSEEKLSEHGATLRMRRTVRRTHEPNRDKRTERFGCFFMYRATPISQSCNNNVQLFVISVAMFAFSVVFVVLGFVSFWWFSSLHFVFFLSIFFSLFLSDFVSQCDQVQVIPIPSVCIIFFILRACLCIYFHLLRETCLTSFFWDAFSFYTTLHKVCSILENSHILCINDRRI